MFLFIENEQLQDFFTGSGRVLGANEVLQRLFSQRNTYRYTWQWVGEHYKYHSGTFCNSLSKLECSLVQFDRV
jgi:hypothetical protein